MFSFDFFMFGFECRRGRERGFSWEVWLRGGYWELGRCVLGFSVCIEYVDVGGGRGRRDVWFRGERRILERDSERCRERFREMLVR